MVTGPFGVCSHDRLADVLAVGPFACTGQPRWAQWFEMIVKLGTCFFVFGSASRRCCG